MTVSIEIAGRDVAIDQLKKLDNALQTKVAKRMAQMAYDLAETRVDSHTVTGALRRSFDVKRVDGGWWTGHDLQHAPHARYVHWGTKPHKIRPIRKKWLRFPVGTGGATKFVFAKVVSHPGYKGDPYLVRVARIVGNRMGEIVKKVTGG